MKRIKMFLVLAAISLAAANGYSGEFSDSWEDISAGIDETGLNTITVDPKDESIFYVGSQKSVFKSSDSGKNWQRLYLVRGSSTAVNIICLDSNSQNIVYVGTQNGLLKSPDGGITWNKLFEGMGGREKEIRHMALDQVNTDRIYIGTANGLFISADGGRTWNRPTGRISNRIINFIAVNPVNPGLIYVAGQTGVFKSRDRGLSWDRVLFVKDQTEGVQTEEISDDTNIDETPTTSNGVPNCITFDPTDRNKVYIGTDSGVVASLDNGQTFNRITNIGLTGKKIRTLIFLNDASLCAAADEGIFRSSRPYDRWDEIYKGLPSKSANCLVYEQKNNFILTATDKGIYRLSGAMDTNSALTNSSPDHDPEMARILAEFESEPTIEEIQKAAIKYAEVHKEKIDEWRKNAKHRALLPTLSVGVDHGVKSTSEIYTSATQQYWTDGPDDDSTGWDVRVSWDLGNLIWSDDQTNIDVRSRLMVELRDDILNEVTHLYFERRRLQIELAMNPPKNLQLRLEKDLRLQELTAGIDALTDGYLSGRIKKITAS